MSKVVMAVEGVLADYPPNGNPLNYNSIAEGRVLYDLFESQHQMLLLTSHLYEERMKAWLVNEHINRWATVTAYDPTSLRTYTQWKADKVQEWTGIGHHISWYIDADPDAVQYVMEGGINAMLVGYPGNYPGRLGEEDLPYVAWTDLIKSIETQKTARAQRLAQEEPPSE